MAETKKRRITAEDHNSVVTFIEDHFKTRKESDDRGDAERKWKAVDRQIAMQPERMVKRDQSNAEGNSEDWHSNIQLGNLADASEVIADDVLRLIFPNDRAWFAPHNEIPFQIDETTGRPIPPDTLRQKIVDGGLLSLMSQQHKDFGFKDRVKLSIKEALHHGSYVAVAEHQTKVKAFGGSALETLQAPVWQPYSMWNCYPDPSPTVIGTDMFYNGDMIIQRSLKFSKLKEMKKWINKDKITKPKRGEDLEVLVFYGDLILQRSSGNDIFLPNRCSIVVQGQFVFSEVNKTPYSPVIYGGYERDDVRDPYYSSPIIKRSPTHKLATQMANNFADGVALHIEPPVGYNRLAPEYAGQSPDFSPGSKHPFEGQPQFQEMAPGEPEIALRGMQVFSGEVDEGTSVDAIRKGVNPGTEQTAFEVDKRDQKSEIRTVDFVGSLERQGLLPFLYMQHYLNREELKNYPFHNKEIHSPDFMRASKTDLTKNVIFEIVGSNSVLGQERRTENFRNAVTFAYGISELAQRTDDEAVLKQLYSDSGVKNPEQFIVLNEEANQVEQLTGQMQQMGQQLEGAQRTIAQLQQQLVQAGIQGQVNQARFNAEAENIRRAEQLEQERKDRDALREQQRKDVEHQQKLDHEQQKHDLEMEALAKKHGVELDRETRSAEVHRNESTLSTNERIEPFIQRVTDNVVKIVREETKPAQKEFDFEYDAAGRIVSAKTKVVGSDIETVTEFQTDNDGNIISGQEIVEGET